ncbi:uncharacterized protein LOC100900265 [Galendromus occidentalis]|uniref:Uncharacterized protein LOC100900265 n=1 Tax=Galendromus occidentalis TaxID=34638 RepID=A0AAJ6VXR6_9ACAR|nr:uncharacterized protein LOC100900265 [Galendromus occidentalis]
MMAIRMTAEPLDALSKVNVQQLPCTVNFSGKASVAQRFDTHKGKTEDGHSSAYFRGYPLVGAEIDVPSGYKGVIFTSTSDGDHGRILKAKSTFDKMSYYNWSNKPSAVDPQQSVVEWLSVSRAIHLD